MSDKLLTGAEFILDAPAAAPAVWGEDKSLLWAAGEPFMIFAPEGTGKTTLAGQLALKRAGLRHPDLIGLPVTPDDRPVLYLALDRPAQVARSFRRMVGEDDRDALEERLLIHRGPLPFDVTAKPDRLAAWAAEADCGTVMVDSLKDLAPDIAKDETGSRLNIAFQHVVAAGIELGVLHHPRKGQAENKRPNTIDDVYGSRWLSAGMGSVVVLWGSPGDPIVDFRHLKTPADEYGPHAVIHDHDKGETTLHQPADLWQLVHDSAARGGVTATEAARHLFGAPEPNRNETEKARRRLERLHDEGKIGRNKGDRRTSETRYPPLDLRSVA
jgi:replicative DNA helicase